MPILDVEIVLKPGEAIRHELAAELADRAAEIFGAPPGATWVKVRTVPADQYAENHEKSSENVYPVFVTILKARLPSPDQLQNEVASLTPAIARICVRPEENVHIIYAPEGVGRVAFGEKVVSAEPIQPGFDPQHAGPRHCQSERYRTRSTAMSTKKPIRNDHEDAHRGRISQAGIQAGRAFGQQVNRAATTARAEAGDRALSPGSVLRLQRTIGNQAVNRAMNGAFNGQAVIQRTQGDASKLAEGEYVEVTSGQSITFTKLSAGCMAMVVFYNGGGGVGYHLAMKIDNATQWSEFLGVIGAQGAAEVHLSSEFIGQAEGWYVKYDIDEAEPDASRGPRSYAELFAEYKSNDAIRDAGWVSASGAVSEWYKEKFGVAPKISTKTEVQVQVP